MVDGRQKAAATPAARIKAPAGGVPRARLTFTPSGTPMSSQAGSSAGKGSAKVVSSSKRSRGRTVGSEDEVSCVFCLNHAA